MLLKNSGPERHRSRHMELRSTLPVSRHYSWCSRTARASDGYRFLDRRAAIPLFFEAFEPDPRRLRNVEERIQTTSESRRVHRYRGYDKAAVRRTANISPLQRCDGILSQKYFDVPLGLNPTKPLF